MASSFDVPANSCRHNCDRSIAAGSSSVSACKPLPHPAGGGFHLPWGAS
jgi:hypothetical protein